MSWDSRLYTHGGFIVYATFDDAFRMHIYPAKDFDPGNNPPLETCGEVTKPYSFVAKAWENWSTRNGVTANKAKELSDWVNRLEELDHCAGEWIVGGMPKPIQKEIGKLYLEDYLARTSLASVKK
jgi:hypothetical protein